MTDKPWSKELGLMFVAMCEGLGFLDNEYQQSVVIECIMTGYADCWDGLLDELDSYMEGKLLKACRRNLFVTGPSPIFHPDIQTAALMQYLGEALGWPPPEDCHTLPHS